MSSGERPIGAAKGKQPNTEALCQTPPSNSSLGGRGTAVRPCALVDPLGVAPEHTPFTASARGVCTVVPQCASGGLPPVALCAQAAEAGKPVYVEKPMALNTEVCAAPAPAFPIPMWSCMFHSTTSCRAEHGGAARPSPCMPDPPPRPPARPPPTPGRNSPPPDPRLDPPPQVPPKF